MKETIMIWDRRPEYMFRARGILEVYQEYVYKLMPYNNIHDVYKQLKYPLTVYEEDGNSIMEFSTEKTKNYAIHANIPKGYKSVRFKIDTNYILDTLSRLDNSKLCKYGTENYIELNSHFNGVDKGLYNFFDDYVIFRYIDSYNKNNKKLHISGYRKIITKGDVIYVNSKIRCNTYIEYTIFDDRCIKGIDVTNH